MPAPIRFGLIGFGRFGKNHARAIAHTEGAELVAIAARSPGSCKEAEAAHPGVATFTDFRDMLARDDIDVVDVAVPTHLHFECGKAALESGKHLFIEKPMAPTVAECRELIRCAEEKNLKLVVGFKRRVAHLWKGVKELVDKGVVGTPQYAVFELWRWPYRQGSGGWRYDIDRVGSWVLEEPVHCFDKARWLLGPALGEPESVFAAASSRQSGHPELQDNFSAMLNFREGCHAVVTQTLSAWGHHHGLKLTGTEGAILAKWDGATDDALPTSSLHYMHSTTREGDIVEIDLPPPTGELYELEQEVASMVRAIRDDAPVFATGEDGAWSIALCEAAQKSIDTGTVIKL